MSVELQSCSVVYNDRPSNCVRVQHLVSKIVVVIVAGIAVVELCACSVVYDCWWNCGDGQYTTKSRKFEQTSLCARHSEQSMNID